VQGSVYVFASYGTLVGEFAAVKNLPPGMSIEYNYNGLNQIVVVPEPATLFLGLTGAMLLYWFKWLQRPSPHGTKAQGSSCSNEDA